MSGFAAESRAPQVPGGKPPRTVLQSFVSWSALALLLVPALVRSLTLTTEFPFWDLDPLAFPILPSGMGPACSLLCDALMIFGAALAFVLAAMRHERLNCVELLAVTAGVGTILYHAFFREGPSLGDQRIGFAWASAMFGAVALRSLARDELIRRVAAAAMLGLIAALCIRGLQQWYIDHPTTVNDFNQSELKLYESQGWAPDSSMARAYKRRVLQREAVGWFGLANVYASLAAAGTASLGAAFVAVLMQRRAGERKSGAFWLSLGFGLGGSAAGIVLAGSKGGLVGSVIGLSVGLLLIWITNHSRRVPAAFLAAIALAIPLAAVVARGAIGDRFGERSLLFRWFYAKAAAVISREHLVAGVGPDGFQQAYLLAKSPLSPEEVRSPHSILLDWISTLGIAGWVWGAVLSWWLYCALRNIGERRAAATGAVLPSPRIGIRALGLIAAAATIVAAKLDTGVMTSDLAGVRVLMLLLWIATGAAILYLPRMTVGICLAALAFTLVLLAGVDVSASWPPSTALVLLPVGLAAGPVGSGTPGNGARRAFSWAAAASAGALAWGVLVFGVAPAKHWTDKLSEASAVASSVRERNDLWRQVHDGSPDEQQAAIKALVRQLGPESQAGLQQALVVSRHTDARALLRAGDLLIDASEENPSDYRPRREASRLLLAVRELAAQSDRPPSSSAIDAAIRTASTPLPRRASDWSWLGVVQSKAADLTGDTRYRSAAAMSFRKAADLDPTNPEHAVKVAKAYDAIGDTSARREWAKRALELDRNCVYDREARSLPEKTMQDLERWAAEP